MSVLHLIPTLGSGGAERQLAYLCEGLVAAGVPTHVGLLSDGPNLQRIRDANVSIHRLQSPSHLDPFLFFHIVRLIRRLRPDVVQTWIPMMDVVGGAAAQLCGVPWILSERSSPQNFPTTTKFRVRAQLAKRAAAVISNSAEGDAYWTERLPPKVPHRIIPNAIPLAAIDACEPVKNIGFDLPDRPLLLSVGRLEPLKNVDGLFEALRRIVDRTSCVALLCGEGSRHAALTDRIRNAGVQQRIACPGVVSNVPAYLKRASVFVSLSRYEGTPNAVLEAMAARCPMVLSDIPAHRNLVGDAALWVDGDDVDAVVAAISQVLDEPALATQRAKDARRAVEGRSIAAAARSFHELYQEVAG